MLVHPHIYLAGVEAQEVTPLEVGDAVFEDKSANVADVDAELVSDCGDVDEPVAVLVSAVVALRVRLGVAGRFPADECGREEERRCPR